MRFCKIKHDGTETDEEILSLASKMPNGEYCTAVCKGCGMFFCEEHGSIKTAKVLAVCRRCIVVPEPT